jgi:hypothetical protein
MATKKTLPELVGYTTSGKPVFLPSTRAPNTNDVVVFQRTKAKFPGWTRRDHMDAENLLIERSRREAREGSAMLADRLAALGLGPLGHRWSLVGARDRARDGHRAVMRRLPLLRLFAGALLCHPDAPWNRERQPA